jgi:hypothetical protein
MERNDNLVERGTMLRGAPIGLSLAQVLRTLTLNAYKYYKYQKQLSQHFSRFAIRLETFIEKVPGKARDVEIGLSASSEVESPTSRRHQRFEETRGDRNRYSHR